MAKDQSTTVYVSNTFPFLCCTSGQQGPKPQFYKQALPFGGLDCYEFSNPTDAKGFRSEVEMLPSSNHDVFFDLAQKYDVCFTSDGSVSKKSEPSQSGIVSTPFNNDVTKQTIKVSETKNQSLDASIKATHSFEDLTVQLNTLQAQQKESKQKHDLNDYHDQIRKLAYAVCASFQATKDRSFLKLCEKLLDAAE